MFIETKAIREYPWYIRLFFMKQKKTYGKVLEPGMLWARAPLVFVGVALLYGALNRRSSPLDGALRSMVTVRISQINHCEFCVDINAATLLKRGASEDKITRLANWRKEDVFENKERLALEFAEAMTITERRVDQDLMDRLLVVYSQDEIAELAGLIGFQNMSSKFNAGLDIAPQGFCQMPKLEGAGG